jgi:hypothetical protein
MAQDGDKVGGSCLCKTVRFEVTLPSRFCAHCHCQNCRRAHGAAFVTWVGFQTAQLSVTAGEDELARYATDTGATRSFCGRCGTPLFYEGPRWPGEVHVARAAIDGEIDKLPRAHVYVDHKAPWFEIGDCLDQYGGTTGMERKAEVGC